MEKLLALLPSVSSNPLSGELEGMGVDASKEDWWMSNWLTEDSLKKDESSLVSNSSLGVF
ncbi:hypothetical protein FRC03_003438 [Tulasnella sp. 419]|nr:hypothetical protein FRC03_003438 [Tulasnella sp. 419]